MANEHMKNMFIQFMEKINIKYILYNLLIFYLK